MARPRNDGKRSATASRIGKPRPTGTGRTWQVRAYKPTDGAPHGRVVYRRPGSDKPTSAVPADGQTVDELFDQIEKALDQQVAIGSTVSSSEGGSSTRRDMSALGDLYIAWLEKLQRNPDYINNRRSILSKWVNPAVGSTLVRDWSVEHSETVLANARVAGLSPARVEDIGSTLSGLRAAGRRKRDGGRWLSPDDDPLEDVSFGRNATIEGAHRDYVKPNLRPTTQRVRQAIDASRDLDVWEWMPDIISIAAFCAPRLSEQTALRAIDVDLSTRNLDINGVWVIVHEADVPGDRRERFRGLYPKNGKRRFTPYLGSQHEALVTRCRKALRLDPETSESEVVATIEAERARRAALTDDGDWRDYVENPDDEPWLFPDESGVPPTRERWNDEWHTVRDAIDWPRYIKYRNMRHHAALYWRAQGFDWTLIALWDGHSVRTLRNFYEIAQEGATEEARGSLNNL